MSGMRVCIAKTCRILGVGRRLADVQVLCWDRTVEVDDIKKRRIMRCGSKGEGEDA